ncbi:hypothetical protein BH18ACI4_BH18ACI4_28140 [soil metagenome]
MSLTQGERSRRTGTNTSPKDGSSPVNSQVRKVDPVPAITKKTRIVEINRLLVLTLKKRLPKADARASIIMALLSGFQG